MDREIIAFLRKVRYNRFKSLLSVLEEIIMKILLRNLTKRFPDRNKKTRGEITAVNDLTLEIPDGK